MGLIVFIDTFKLTLHTKHYSGQAAECGVMNILVIWEINF